MRCQTRHAKKKGSVPFFRGGFTLVELLVVIAVIGLLVGLMIPAVQASRESARTANCASNMRQVGLAITRYCDTFFGRWPETTHTVEADPITGLYDKAWIYTLAPYTEDVDAIRICPSDQAGELRLRAKATSYTLNGYLSKESHPAFDNRRKVKAMSKTIVAFELSEKQDQGAMNTQNPAYVSVFNDHVHSFAWFTNSNINNNNVFKVLSNEISVDRHGGAAHYLYADGHLGLIPQEKIDEWAREPFNFARPPN